MFWRILLSGLLLFNLQSEASNRGRGNSRDEQRANQGRGAQGASRGGQSGGGRQQDFSSSNQGASSASSNFDSLDVSGGLKKMLKMMMQGKYESGGFDKDSAAAADILLKTTTEYITDDLLLKQQRHIEFPAIIGRDHEARLVLRTLVRSKGKNPVLVGPRGAGKTTIVHKVARMLLEEDYSQHPKFKQSLDHSFVIETSVGQIAGIAKANTPAAQMQSMQDYIQAVQTVEAVTGKKIIVFIDELHTLSPHQQEALKTYMDSSERPIRLIGGSTGTELRASLKNNPAFLRRINEVGVSEESEEVVMKILQGSKIPWIEREYGFQFPEDALEVLIENAIKLFPDKSLVDASLTLAEDIAIDLAERKKNDRKIISMDMVYKYMSQKLGRPVDPLDVDAWDKYENDMRTFLNSKVLHQERMIDDLVDEVMNLLLDISGKGVRSIVIAGPSGSGKTEVVKWLVIFMFKSTSALHYVNGGTMKTGGFALGTEFGTPKGVDTQSKSSGRFMDYLDDPGRGKFGGVVFVDEFEKAHPDYPLRTMQFLDQGKDQGGDGITRRLNGHLVVFASNKIDAIIYPPELSKLSLEESKERSRQFSSEKIQDTFLQVFTQEESGLGPEVFARVHRWTLANQVNEEFATDVVESATLPTFAEAIRKKLKVKIEVSNAFEKILTKSYFVLGMGNRPVVLNTEALLTKLVMEARRQVRPEAGQTLFFDVDPGTEKISVTNKATGKTYPLSTPFRDSLETEAPMMCGQMFTVRN